MPKRSRIRKISANLIERAPIRHPKLPPKLLGRISAIHDAFAETGFMPLDKWVDCFRRDMHPEREVMWWEGVVGIYQREVIAMASNRMKRRAFKAVFDHAMGFTR